MEGEFFAGFKGLFFGNRWFDDKGVRHFWVKTKHPGVLRRRGLKDIRIDALLLQKAFITCLAPDHANNPFKGISKTAAKGRAFIRGKAYVLFGADGESEFCKPKCFEHRKPVKCWFTAIERDFLKSNLSVI